MRYVVGFMFDKELERVALIRKQKPEWQKGQLNGIGGKIEFNETPHEAMVREFREEAGLLKTEWREFVVLVGKDYQIHFYFSVIDSPMFDKITTQEVEQIEKIPVADLPIYPTIYNVQWLIPMAKWIVIQSCEVTNLPFIIAEK